MLTVIAYLALTTVTNNTAFDQKKLDRLIKRCAAEKYIKLTAKGDGTADYERLNHGPPLSDVERRSIECVNRGVRRMKIEMNIIVKSNFHPEHPPLRPLTVLPNFEQ